MDHVRARSGCLSLSMAALVIVAGCGESPEAPPADDAPATPAPAQETTPATPEGSGPEEQPVASPIEGS